MLKTEKEIVALDTGAYLSFLALSIEIGGKTNAPLAKIKKGFSAAAKEA
jgi:hypothetical protein